jgi:hypothetical protein
MSVVILLHRGVQFRTLESKMNYNEMEYANVNLIGLVQNRVQ